jgi:hypothetical protein
MPATRTERHPEQEMDVMELLMLLLLGVLLTLPRIAIAGFAIFNSKLFDDAFGGWVVPAIGWVVLPWTTLAYASMWSISSDAVSGYEWIVVALGLIVDLYTWSAFRPRKE